MCECVCCIVKRGGRLDDSILISARPDQLPPPRSLLSSPSVHSTTQPPTCSASTSYQSTPQTFHSTPQSHATDHSPPYLPQSRRPDPRPGQRRVGLLPLRESPGRSRGASRGPDAGFARPVEAGPARQGGGAGQVGRSGAAGWGGGVAVVAGRGKSHTHHSVVRASAILIDRRLDRAQ